MEIIFESNTTEETVFDYNGQKIINLGLVQIVKDFFANEAAKEAQSL